jgi:hypothetical protein
VIGRHIYIVVTCTSGCKTYDEDFYVLFNAVVKECEQSRVAYSVALMGSGIPFGRSSVYLEQEMKRRVK